jgi:hypothetical protein
MGNGRLIAIAIALCAVSYAATQWLSAVRVIPLKPDQRVPSFHRVDPDSPRTQVEASHASDMDPVRDRLRWAVVDSADSLSSDPCNDGLKARYVNAATNYARAWLSVAPCVATRTCSSADEPLLQRAQEAFGSPLDHRVRDAMHKAHQTDAIRDGDFPKDVVNHVALLAADPVINPLAEPKIKQTFRDERTPLSCRVSAR